MKHTVITSVLCSLLALAPMALCSIPANAASVQQNDVIKVSGKVVDESGEPVIGAGVLVLGTTNGTTTDYDGSFTINVPSGAILQFVALGYETLEVEVAGRADLGTVVLKAETTLLDQIVVVGYGSQKKVDLTGSVAIVDADEMKKVSHSNISSMLEGKVAGVQITSDGQPGADPSVRIRGLGSFGSTAPLYVIDGVPMGTSIRDFSPNDIETIQVLKDASAAAIYGSRAANGVIIITTKGGKKNQQMKVDYSGYVGVDRIRGGVYEVMDSEQYGEYLRMAFDNNNMDVPAGYDKNSEKYINPSSVNTNWFEEMFKPGIRQNHNVNLSGGGENNTYNVALDYFSQKGTLEGAGPDFDRFTARVNNTMDIKFIKLRTGIVYSHSRQNNMSQSNANEYVQGLYGEQYPVMLTTLIMPPTIKAYDDTTWCLDDILAPASEYSYDSYGYGTYYADVHGDVRINNPLLMNNLLERRTSVDRLVATGSANVDLLGMFGVSSANHQLSYNLNLSYSRTFCNDFTFVPSYIQSTTHYLAKSNETLTEGYRTYTDGLIENYITYNGIFGKHHVNAVLGQTFEREYYHTLTGTGTKMPEPYYLQVGNAESRDASSYESEHVLASYIGRLNYDFDGKYLFQATVRRDGSSRLSSANHWDWFPSFSAGWRIDKEDFFNVDRNLVSLLKLRASYGILGNENIGEYQYMDTMARGNYTYSFGGNKVTGSAISNYVNTAIHWEKKKTLDIGLDYAMFGGKLEFTADWYHANSEDLLYSVAVPAEAGATNTDVTMNAASMLNTGLEFSAAYHNYDRDLKYDISANVTFPKNKVTSLGISGEGRTDGFCRTEVGEEVGRFFGYVYEGIYTTPEQLASHASQNGAQLGDAAFKDLNGDGEITDQDRTFIGSGMPDVQAGLSARFEYKGFDLSISTYGAFGYKLVDYVDMMLHNSYGLYNKSVDLADAWTPDNSSSTIPAVYFKNVGSVTNDMFCERQLQSGNYWKIANVELGYNFKDQLFGGYFSNVRLYVSGQNLATISKYRGYNIDFAGGTFTPGYNYCSYPAPVTVMLGAKFSF